MRHNNPGSMASECDQLFVSERQAAGRLVGDEYHNTVHSELLLVALRT